MAVAMVAVFVALGGTSYAVISSSTVPDSLGVFHACVSRSSGGIRIVTKPSACQKAVAHGKHKTRGELAVSWSQTGPAGKNGANGTNGANGANGINGINGAPAGTRFFATDPTSAADHTIATIGPLTLQGGCSAGGIPDLRASVSEENNTMENVFGHSTFGNTETGPGEFITLTNGQVEFGGLGTAHFLTYTSHQDIQIEWFVRPSNALGAGTGCFYSGYVTIL
jgi:hypothetical protein